MSLLYKTVPHLINLSTRIILTTPMSQLDFGVSNPSAPRTGIPCLYPTFQARVSFPYLVHDIDRHGDQLVSMPHFNSN